MTCLLFDHKKRTLLTELKHSVLSHMFLWQYIAVFGSGKIFIERVRCTHLRYTFVVYLHTI